MNYPKNERLYSQVDDSNELNDSLFQKEGDYYIDKMPKYKYEIKVIHPSPTRTKKPKTPDTIASSARFTIINKSKKNQPNNQKIIHFNDKNYETNKKHQLFKSKSPRTLPTIRFYSGDYFDNKYTRNSTFEKSFNFPRKHKRYTNKINNIKNYNNQNYDYSINRDDSNYIIEIFPSRPCICQAEISKILNGYFGQKHSIYNYNSNNNNYKYNHTCGCLCNFYDNQNTNTNVYNMEKRNNNNYYNIYSPPRQRIIKHKNKVENSIKNIYAYENRNIPYESNILKNNYYYDINSNSNTKVINNKKIIIKNKCDNNNYLETSEISGQKKNQLKKIKMTLKNRNNRMESNHSFLSLDNLKNKNSSPNSTRLTINRKFNKKYYGSPYKNKSQNLSNNCNNTMMSNGRKSSNIMINKSSERHERLKVVKIGEKIKPLEVKKLVEKPVKETIKNEDGTTTNVIRQNSVITSIETKPVVNDNNRNKKDEKLVKEYITKVYTTLTKKENEVDENINNDRQDNMDKILNEINTNNENIYNKNGQKNIINSPEKLNKNNENQNNNINIDNNDDNNGKIQSNIKNNYNFNNNLEINNDLLIHKNNNNSSFNYSSLYSNIYEMGEQNNNNTRINEIINYIKYLYCRYANLPSSKDAKEETLTTYFLKLIDDERIAVLNKLNDGNDEDKNIYNKLSNILEENYNDLIIDDEEDEKYESNNKMHKSNNILFKKKKVVK